MTNPKNSLSSSLRTFPSSHGQGQRYALIASTFWCHHQVKRINAWWGSFPAHPVAMASGLQVGRQTWRNSHTSPLDPQSRFTGPTAARCHFSFWDLSFTISNLEDLPVGSADFGRGDVGDRLVRPGRSDCGWKTAVWMSSHPSVALPRLVEDGCWCLDSIDSYGLDATQLDHWNVLMTGASDIPGDLEKGAWHEVQPKTYINHWPLVYNHDINHDISSTSLFAIFHYSASPLNVPTGFFQPPLNCGAPGPAISGHSWNLLPFNVWNQQAWADSV